MGAGLSRWERSSYLACYLMPGFATNEHPPAVYTQFLLLASERDFYSASSLVVEDDKLLFHIFVTRM